MSLVNATRSELAKQFTTSGWWVLGLVLALYIGSVAAGLAGAFGALSDGALPGATSGLPAMDPAAVPPLVYSSATSLGYIFPLLVGILMSTGEFRHKTLTPTFLATPRRPVALAGKVIAGVVMGLLYAGVALATTVAPSAGVLALFHQPTGLDDSAIWALLGRMVLAYVLWVLIGIGVGALVRNQVAAIVGVLAFTQFLEPILRMIGTIVDGVAPILRWLPGAASDALVGASIYTSIGGAADSVQWWAGALTLLAYALAFLGLGYLVGWRRDVT